MAYRSDLRRAQSLAALLSASLLALRPVAAAGDVAPAPASAPAAGGADGGSSVESTDDVGQRFAVHGQATFGRQWTDGFHAPYAGPNSLSPASTRETLDVTLSLGARLWSGAEIWATPEIDQGFGLDNTVGMAGFPSGLDYKVGSKTPYYRLPRAFVRQTINQGGGSQSVAGLAGQFAGVHTQNRWVFTLGKFAVTDVFDTNQYAHDPRADFFNWAIVDTGTFDYAADAWGYTYGVAAERYVGAWALRLGVFDLSSVPNGESIDPNFDEFQLDGEIERRYALFGQTGRVILTAFDSRGRMALLDATIALAEATATAPSPAAVRRYRGRIGLSLDVEQPITADFGLFARAGKAAGNIETYEFTDIDRTVALGGSLKGRRWGRQDDTVGLAVVDNGISAEREAYLNLGGLGVLVGDGKLPRPGAEQILETYYSLQALPWLNLSFDYQWVGNPAYNRDRGPVSIFGLRVHAGF